MRISLVKVITQLNLYNMKKNVFLFSLFLLLFVANGVYAQKEKSVGVSAGLVFLDEIDYAKVGVEYNMDLSKSIRFSPSIDGYFGTNSCVAIHADFNYLIPLTDKIKFFPILGVSYVTDDLVLKSDRLGVNAGLGLQHDLSDKFALNAKLKYQILDHSDLMVLGIGLVRKF